MLGFVSWGSCRRPNAAAPLVATHRRRRSLAALIAGAIVLLAGAPGAEAACGRSTNFVDSSRLFLDGTARATSSDGKTYDRIESGSFKATFQIELCHPGALDGVIVHLGECTGHNRGCDQKPIMYHVMPAARDFHETRTFEYAIPTDSDAGKSILQTCNARALDQRGAAGDLEIYPGFFAVTLGVDTRRQLDVLLGPQPGIGFLNTPLQEYSKTAPSTLNLRILCAPLPTPKITGAQLAVAAYGDTCPKPAGATVRINAEYPRPVSYKLERGDGTTTTDDWIKDKIELGKAPDGSQQPFLSAQHKLPPLDAGNHKFRLWISDWGKTPWWTVKVDCPPFQATSMWLTLEEENKSRCPREVDVSVRIDANRSGSVLTRLKNQAGVVMALEGIKMEREGNQYVGRYKTQFSMNAIDTMLIAEDANDPATNSGWVPLKIECLEVLSGTLDLRGFAATRCEGEAALSIRTNMAGKVPYRLDCTGGRSWERTAQVRKTGPGTYLGVDTIRFDVTNNEQVNCALKTDDPLPFKVLALQGRKYECHRPSGASGAADFVPETRPDPTGPPPPPRVVADPPRVCPAGTVGKWPSCRKRECPSGTVGKWPNCKQPPPARVTPPKVCPPGMVGRPPSCRPRPCPPGQVRVRGRCIKPAG
jgi:hypothetical protein